MSKVIQYSDEPLGDLMVVADFLPSPEELALKKGNTKVTLSLGSESVAYFQEVAKRYHSSYQKIIIDLLNDYVAQAHGINTSGIEVTHVSSHGICLLSGGNEHFLSYEDFPWFKEAPIGKVLNIEEVSPGHFHWPDLDIDLGLDTIKHPEKYPLELRDKS